jgi:penicillin-binding protein 1A
MVYWRKIMKNFLLKNLKILLVTVSLLVTVLLGILLGLILVYQKGFPQIKNLEDINPVVMTTVYDDQNIPIKDFAIEKRVIVKDVDIPPMLKKALIAAEDNQFYSHWGINFRGGIRAIGGLLLRKKWGGGSSITQQLARGLFLTPGFSISRKLQEMLLAIQIEKKYTKDQILTFYCNKIFFGGSIYGIEAAARYYFGKSVKEINLAEAALMAGIVPNPNGIYSVFKRPDNVLRRRNYILMKMLLLRFITSQEYQEALTVKLPSKAADAGSESLADYFTEDARKYLETKYGDNLLYKGGLKVFTTLNGEMQKWAENALREGLRSLDKRRGWRSREKLFNLLENKLNLNTYQLPAWENATIEPNQIIEGVVMEIEKTKVSVRLAGFKGEMPLAAAQWTKKTLARLFKVGDVALFRIVALDKTRMRLELSLEQEPDVDGALLAVDNKSGEIKAMVGGYAFQKSKFNRAIQALRQTGSTFKPIIYTAALEHGFSAASIIQDEPFSYVDEWTGTLWEPSNHKSDYIGPITFRRALEQSRNVVTARILQAITPQVGVDYAKKFGISSALKPYMSLALGAFEVTLKEMVEAFTVFPNYGFRVNSYFIRSIRDLNNNIIEENLPERKQVIEKETAFVMNYLLQGVVKSGTGWRARSLPAPVGGKTGTTNDFTDAWFIGFTPTLTVGVWVGFDQKKSLGEEMTGGVAASPIFVKFMESYLNKYPETNKFQVPSGVYMINIDKFTGKLLTPDCLYPFQEAFLPGTEPLEFCNDEEHQKFFNYFKTETESTDD